MFRHKFFAWHLRHGGKNAFLVNSAQHELFLHHTLPLVGKIDNRLMSASAGDAGKESKNQPDCLTLSRRSNQSRDPGETRGIFASGDFQSHSLMSLRFTFRICEGIESGSQETMKLLSVLEILASWFPDSFCLSESYSSPSK